MLGPCLRMHTKCSLKNMELKLYPSQCTIHFMRIGVTIRMNSHQVFVNNSSLVNNDRFKDDIDVIKCKMITQTGNLNCEDRGSFSNDRSLSLPNLADTEGDFVPLSKFATSEKFSFMDSEEGLNVGKSNKFNENKGNEYEEISRLLSDNSTEEQNVNLAISREDCHLLVKNRDKASLDNLQNLANCDNISHDAVVERTVGKKCQSLTACDHMCSCDGSNIRKEIDATKLTDNAIQGITLKVNPENSRLSTVLENIPLVYIPQTRMLSVQSEETCVQSSACSSSRNNDNSIQFELEESISNLKFVCDPVAMLDSPPKQSFSRSNSSTCPTCVDASSFSSASSIGTDFSLSAVSEEISDSKMTSIDLNDDAEFVEINLHSRNTFEKANNVSQDSGIDDGVLQSSKEKRHSISNFLAKSLFSRKNKEHTKLSEPASPLGWKLFGKVPPKQVPSKDAAQICEEYQARHRIQQFLSPNRCRKKDLEIFSTTALILENRPLNLPSKSPEEELKHRQEYDAMVEAAKRKEMKELKKKKKLMQHQLRMEDQLAASLKIWNNDILPSWESLKESKKAKDLWWQGIPPSVRGKVWKLAIGNDLNLTQELYEICLGRAHDYLKLLQQCSEGFENFQATASKEASVDVIRLDVSRTFPQLKVFQKGGPYHDLLHSLLGAYTSYRPDVGYVQGMSFLAAVLMLNMEVADAFICFANLLNKPCQVAFFRIDETLMKAYFQAFEEFFQENLPKLHEHFRRNNLTPDLYIIDWIFTLYSKSLPLDVASRVWDVFCRDGEEFLFRTALGILNMFEEVLYNLDFIHLAQFLTKLPENISSDRLFKCIERIKMHIDKKKFVNVLAAKKELLLSDKERDSTDGAT